MSLTLISQIFFPYSKNRHHHDKHTADSKSPCGKQHIRDTPLTEVIPQGHHYHKNQHEHEDIGKFFTDWEEMKKRGTDELFLRLLSERYSDFIEIDYRSVKKLIVNRSASISPDIIR